MKAIDLLVGFNSVKDSYVISAEEFRQGKQKAQIKCLSVRKVWLIAAVIALTLLLVGCAVAYANGWFQMIFTARSETPLSSEQIEYIQNNEQSVGQSQTIDGWTIDLKSTISDGRLGYLVFRITAPENMDLEQYLNPARVEDKHLSMGNNSASRNAAYSYAIASIGTVDDERNYWYLDSWQWISDEDGKPNTVLFCLTLSCERIDPNKPMLLEEPFGKDVSFRIRLLGITLEYTNMELQREIEEKHTGQEYMVEGEEAAGLFCSDILTDQEWYFDVTFDPDNQFMELITQPVSAQAKVWRYADEKRWDTVDSLEEIQISSFRVTPFGASISYVPKPDAIGISLNLSQNMDAAICAVMKDGSCIKLDGVGTDNMILQAETPIVLSQLDHILLEDGTKLYTPDAYFDF